MLQEQMLLLRSQDDVEMLQGIVGALTAYERAAKNGTLSFEAANDLFHTCFRDIKEKHQACVFAVVSLMSKTKHHAPEGPYAPVPKPSEYMMAATDPAYAERVCRRSVASGNAPQVVIDYIRGQQAFI